MAMWLRQWQGKGSQQGPPADLPYANGLPAYYKISLGARIIRLCAAATASTSAVVVAWSCLSPFLMVAPFYIVTEIIFAIVLWRRWLRFNEIQHDAHGGIQRQSASAAAPVVIDAAAASACFEAVATALERGGRAEVTAFLRLWFHDNQLCEIRRGNLLDLLAYAFFYAHSSSDVAAEGHGALLEAMADRLEALLLPPTPTATSPTSHHDGPTGSHMPPGPATPASCSGADASSTSPETSAAAVTAPVAAAATLSASSSSWQPAVPPRVLHPGRNPRLRFMAHMAEPLPHFYRPLAFYVAMEAMAWINHCMLLGAGYRRLAPLGPNLAADAAAKGTDRAVVGSQGCGFGAAAWAVNEEGGTGDRNEGSSSRRSSSNSFSSSKSAIADGGGEVGGASGCSADDHCYYVVNLPAAHTEGCGRDRSVGGGVVTETREAGPDVPIVFLHGVGMGLLPYFRLLVALAATGAPVIAFELKHVSQRWTAGEPPSMQQLADDVVSALRRHGYSQAAVLAHSFGTAVASVLMQSYPGVVRHVTMLDPICFQMYLPRLLRNFIYRRLGATGIAATAHAAAVAAAAAAPAAAAAAAATMAAEMAAAAAEGAPCDCDGISVPGNEEPAAGTATAAPPQPAPPQAPASQHPAAVCFAGTAATCSSSEPNRRGGALGRLLSSMSKAMRMALGLPLDLLMLGPARELHCTALLCRRVVWSEVNLWEHLVPESCTVVLSGRDDLMCARSLECWLRDHTPASVVVHPELLHAQICLAWTRQDQVLDQMLRNVYGRRERTREVYDNSHCITYAGCASATFSAPRRLPASLGGEGTRGRFDGVPITQTEQRDSAGDCFGMDSCSGRGSVATAESWAGSGSGVEAARTHDADSDVEMQAGVGPRKSRRGWPGRLENEGAYLLTASAELCSGGGGCSPCRVRRRRIGEAFASGADDDEDCENAFGASQLRQVHASVVRHDSAGSYLRLQSIAGLGVMGAETTE